MTKWIERLTLVVLVGHAIGTFVWASVFINQINQITGAQKLQTSLILEISDRVVLEQKRRMKASGWRGR